MGDELNTLIQLTNKAIAQYAGAEARIESLQELVGDLKRQMTQALVGIGETQKNMVLALEKLNTNIEDHKVIHSRIDDGKEAHEEVLAHIENIHKVLAQNGIWAVREGSLGLGDLISRHERFVNRLEGKVGMALLAAVLLGTFTDFACHYDFVKRFFSLFTG